MGYQGEYFLLDLKNDTKYKLLTSSIRSIKKKKKKMYKIFFFFFCLYEATKDETKFRNHLLKESDKELQTIRSREE